MKKLEATSPSSLGRPAEEGSRRSKVTLRHLNLLAIVYVRQSSLQQVCQHAESRQRQYELVDEAVALGWPRDRVVLIDEDQGLSGQSVEQRDGFQRLLAEVSLGHVGLVFGLEMSRLSRSSLDFQRLLQICELRGTLIGDQEGLYDPHDANDRLLLGLKGTMSEFELLTMRGRLERGREHKAQRGALFHEAPIGYVKVGPDQVELDPDEQVRGVVGLIFRKFAELGSLGALLRYLHETGVRIGVRVRGGARHGQLDWRAVHRSTLRQMLHHPIYAGAYSYGRQGRAAEQARVLKRDCLPAYISWEQYQSNRTRLQQNRCTAQTAGVARRGAGLLAGLVVCGGCGHHMVVEYPSRGRPYYRCRWRRKNAKPGRCGPGLSATCVDELLGAQVLEVLEPARLELHLEAAQQIEQERQRLGEHWRRRLEQARYEAERAERQYQAVEPENRLVARTLEQRWEEALRRQRELTEEYARQQRRQPACLTEKERLWISELSKDIPQLWGAESTSMADRKEVVRCLVERVEVYAKPDSEQTQVVISWHGGATSTHAIERPVSSISYMSDGKRLLRRVKELRGEAKTAKQIAACLNAEGFVPPQRRGAYTPDGVRQMLVRLGLTSGKKTRLKLGQHEWRVEDLARELGMATVTLRTWLRQGLLKGRQVPPRQAWVAWADKAELRRLRQLGKERSQAAHKGEK
jgi:DNA invertase Pin-like site-specific DNA recombinase